MSEENNNANGNIDADMQPLNVMGDTYYTRYTRKFINRQHWSKPDERELLSIIPGTVREMYVKEGDVIRHGQKLLILEAMKMMNTIYSPADGIIETVGVKIGDRIPKGTLILKFA
jgi:biotin carboxyl carrier protein